jgi:hypothetical protein
VKLASKHGKSLVKYLKRLNYQQELTRRLDKIQATFDQHTVNEIVLWKVNRYAPLDYGAFKALESSRYIKRGEHASATSHVITLLEQRGVDLPMASTLLRFRNPTAFQIIDRRAYRAFYGKGYPLYSASSVETKLQVYFEYLENLLDLCEQFKLDFTQIDRMLYVFDKEENGAL